MNTTYVMTSTFLVIVLGIIFFNVARKLAGHEKRKISLILIGATIFYVIMDCVWIAEYLSPNYNKALFTVLNLLFYSIYITLPYIWFRFSQNFVGDDFLKNKAINIAAAVPWLFNVVLIILTVLGTGTVWTIGDADMRYDRGPMFSLFSNLNMIYYFIPVVEILWKSIANKEQNRKYYLSTLGFSLVPALGVFIYTYFIPKFDIYPFQPFCFFLGVIFAYFFVIEQMEKAYQKKYEKELEDALSKAEAASKAKSAFLFNISHDIRTPMNAILGFNNRAIRNIDDKEKVLDSLNKANLSGESLLGLINDILDMSRVESGKATINHDKADMNKSFIGIEPMLRELAEAKNIDLSFTVGDIKHRYNYVDFSHTERVLVNIITNAIKYTPEGGKVDVSVCELDEEKDGKPLYRFTVADNGQGMSEEFQQQMYEEFSREKNTTQSGVVGTGLGLALSRSLVDLMGGRISCESRLGEGTTFTIDLPFEIRDPEQAEEIESDGETTGFSLGGKRILLVEDNEMNMEIATELLEDEGALVYGVENGLEAVNEVKKKHAKYYDCILMDIQMPVMNGYEATKAIRELPPHEYHIPIIAVSANAFEEDRQKSLAAGMDDHIAKPIDVKVLKETLARYL